MLSGFFEFIQDNKTGWTVAIFLFAIVLISFAALSRADDECRKSCLTEKVEEAPSENLSFETQENIADCISGCLQRASFDYCKKKCSEGCYA